MIELMHVCNFSVIHSHKLRPPSSACDMMSMVLIYCSERMK